MSTSISSAHETKTTKLEKELAALVAATKAQKLGAELSTPLEPETTTDSPWYKTYKTVVEESHKHTTMTLLSELIGDKSWPKKFDLLVSDFREFSEYTEEEKKLIPTRDKTYYPDPELLYDFCASYEHIAYPKTFCSGDPGTGKSTLPEFYCAITGRPFMRFNFNGQLDVSDLLGTTHVAGGRDYFTEGLIPKAYQAQNMLLLEDEVTYAPAEVHAAQHRMLEDNGCLVLSEKNCKTISDSILYPGKNLFMVFSDNTLGQGDISGKFTGTQPMNSAFMDRISTFLHFDFMPVNVERKVLTEQFPSATVKFISCAVDLAGLCRRSYKQDTLSTVFSFRVLKTWMQHALARKDYRKGLALSFIDRLDSDTEKQLVWNLVATVFGD